MPEEERQLAWIANAISVDLLRSQMRNAKGKSAIVHGAALERLVEVSASDYTDPIAKACWTMVYTVEEIRRDLGKTWRMNRLRKKIEVDGERAALEYCALNDTAGFAEVLSYGLPQFTAEAIVLRFRDTFSETTQLVAQGRLLEAGVDPKTLA